MANTIKKKILSWQMGNQPGIWFDRQHTHTIQKCDDIGCEFNARSIQFLRHEQSAIDRWNVCICVFGRPYNQQIHTQYAPIYIMVLLWIYECVFYFIFFSLISFSFCAINVALLFLFLFFLVYLHLSACFAYRHTHTHMYRDLKCNRLYTSVGWLVKLSWVCLLVCVRAP